MVLMELFLLLLQQLFHGPHILMADLALILSTLHLSKIHPLANILLYTTITFEYGEEEKNTFKIFGVIFLKKVEENYHCINESVRKALLKFCVCTSFGYPPSIDEGPFP